MNCDETFDAGILYVRDAYKKVCRFNKELHADLEKFRSENAKLREDLEFERSENGWAREFLNRIGQKCGTKDCPSLVAYVTKMEAENAKLRELTAQMGEMLDCDICDRSRECNWQDDDLCWYEIELRKLGVEVDDGTE